MRRIFFFLFFLLVVPSLSIAENHYVSQSGGGGGGSCGAADRSASWFNTSGNWGAGAGKISPGDTVYLCNTITSGLTVQGSGSSGSVITIDGASGTLSSTLTVTSKSYITFNSLTWASGVNGDYRIIADLSSNLIFDGTTIPNYGPSYGDWFFRLFGTSYIVVKNSNITNSYGALFTAGVSGSTVSHHHTYQNNYITTAAVYDDTRPLNIISIPCSHDMTIEGNYFVHSWDTGTTGDHSDIIEGWGTYAGCPSSISNVVIRYNWMEVDRDDYDGNFQFIILGDATADIYSNVFVKKGTDIGGAFLTFRYTTGTVNIYNNTIVNKDYAPNWVLQLDDDVVSGAVFNFENNIVYNATSSLGKIERQGSYGTINHTYNIYYGGCSTCYLGTSCSSYISTEESCDDSPNDLFLDYANDDLRVGTGSPAYEAGTTIGSPYDGLSTASLVFPDPPTTSRPKGTYCEIGAYEVDTSDTTPPVRYNSTPGSLPSGTTQYNMGWTTTDDSGGANCRVGTIPLVAYADMTNVADTTGGTSHSELVTGLSDGNCYDYYIRCEDLADPPNANPDDYPISFCVQEVGVAGGAFTGSMTFQ